MLNDSTLLNIGPVKSLIKPDWTNLVLVCGMRVLKNSANNCTMQLPFIEVAWRLQLDSFTFIISFANVSISKKT